MNGRSIVMAIALMAGCARPALSQATNAQAQLNGSVDDPNGRMVVNAAITLRDVGINQCYRAVTNDRGYYAFTNLPPADYELTAAYAGFTDYTRTGLALSVGQVATVDIRLTMAAAGERVVVNLETPAIEPTRTEISSVVETQRIAALPISGRLFTDFALLSPGVATGRTSLQSTFTDPSTTRISFGGQRDLNNMVTVDGADNINTATGSQRATPSQEAVSQFRVINNSFGAEYGRALGGIVNVITKSGSNTLHGSVYAYGQDNAVDANSPLAVKGFTLLQQNQFGATLGGPVQKDRLFYFANYEGQRRRQSPTYPAVLVDNLAAINAVKASFNLAPEQLNVVQTADVDNGFFKFDSALNGSNRLSTRYLIQDARDLNMLVGATLDGGGVGAPSSAHNGFLRDQAFVGTLTSVLTRSEINSILLQWARRNYGFPGVSGQPNLDIPNLLLFGHNFGAFDRYNESRIQLSDTFSMVAGRHSASAGVDSNFIHNFVVWPGFTPSRDIFPSLGDLLASARSEWGSTPCPAPLIGLVAPCIAAFFWGAPIGSGPFDPAQPSPSVPTDWQNAYLPSETDNFNTGLHHGEFGLFAQDQFRITSKLALNYGIRWDFETGFGKYVNPDRASVQPRVGLAYSPDPKTVIRAGYGIFYDTYSLTFFFVAGPQRPPVIPGLPTAQNQRTGTYLLNTLAIPTPCLLAGCPENPYGPNTPPGTVIPPLVDTAFENLISSGSFPDNSLYAQGGTAVDRGLRQPHSQQSSLQIDRQLGKGLAVSAGYLWVAGHELVRPIDLNVGPPIGHETGTNKDIYGFGLFVPSIPAPPGGEPGTNGIFYYTDSTGNSDYNGLLLQATEKLGETLRLQANYTFSKTFDNGTFTTFVSTPQSNDQRNLERALSNQDVRHRLIADFVADAPQHSWARRFELSGIVTIQTPRPFTLFVGFDANNDGNPVTDRVGSSPRNTYFGDGLRTWDARLSRTFTIPDHAVRIQLAVDGFNLLNRANIDEVYSVYGAPNFIGAIPHHYKDGVASPANAYFGTPRTAFNPRQLQFSAKFTF
ncbi:MAG: carboxypeptidase regulatory-like domain-containing protein [Acidobacteriaceae bacterium]